MVAVGHEYWDTSHEIEGGDGHGDEHGDEHGELQDVRGHNLAFYRAGVNVDLPTSTHELEVALSLNSMLGTSYGAGRIWQEQLEDCAGEHELEHALYHKVGAGLEVVVADGVLLLGVGADYAHTINGDIQQDGKDGDYRIGVFTFFRWW